MVARPPLSLPVLGTMLCTAFWAGCAPEASRQAPSSPDLSSPDLSTETEVAFLDPPAGPGALAANWQVGDSVALSWLEPADQGHLFKVSELQGETWTEPREIAGGSGFFANWADLPGTVADDRGHAFAHWLQKLGDGTYAYGVQQAHRDTAGAWQGAGLLHEDASPQEHGFVSYAPLPGGGVQAFWLDGGQMGSAGHGADHDGADDASGHGSAGSMELRTRLLGGDDKGPETVLDPRVCECCATDAAWTAAGPLVVFRDRSEDEIRDIYVVRRQGETWTEPRPVHQDGWQINGCPVNGPAVGSDGETVAVAWFTAAPTPRVQVAFSRDAGATFDGPVVIDDQWPIGRVDLAMAENGDAVVAWMGTGDAGADIRWRRLRSDGTITAQGVAAPTTEKRSSGVTRMRLDGDRLLFAWIHDDGPQRLRVGAVRLP